VADLRKTAAQNHLFLLANGLLAAPTRPENSLRGRTRLPISSRHSAQLEATGGAGVSQNPEHQLVATSVAKDLSYGLVNLAWDDTKFSGGLAGHRSTSISKRWWIGLGCTAQTGREKANFSLADVMIWNLELLLLDGTHPPTSAPALREAIASAPKTHPRSRKQRIVVASHDL